MTDQCRCKKRGLHCTYPSTQEDLLCDHCRAGCGIILAGTIPVHVNNTGSLDVTGRLQEAADFGGDLVAEQGLYAVSTPVPLDRERKITGGMR